MLLTVGRDEEGEKKSMRQKVRLKETFLISNLTTEKKHMQHLSHHSPFQWLPSPEV